MTQTSERQRGRDIGPTGRTVAANLLRLRGTKSLRDLEADLIALGHRITPSALQKIEVGIRRVDVDDLMALAVALNVNPTALLMPNRSGDEDASDAVTGAPEGTTAQQVWAWADGWQSLQPPAADESEESPATGGERGRSEARRRMPQWNFLDRVRPIDERREHRSFVASVVQTSLHLEPGQWLSLWSFTGSEKTLGKRSVAYPEGGWADISKYFERMKRELEGVFRSDSAGPFLAEVTQDFSETSQTKQT